MIGWHSSYCYVASYITECQCTICVIIVHSMFISLFLATKETELTCWMLIFEVCWDFILLLLLALTHLPSRQERKQVKSTNSLSLK